MVKIVFEKLTIREKKNAHGGTEKNSNGKICEDSDGPETTCAYPPGDTPSRVCLLPTIRECEIP